MGFISSLFGSRSGQGTSAETKRKSTKLQNKSNKPNKLSKPRTNTSTNNLLATPTGGVSRKSSQVDINTRVKRRSMSVPARTDGQLTLTGDVGIDTGLSRGRPEKRDKRASRLSSLFRSKSSTPSTTTVLQERTDDQWASEANSGTESLASLDPLRRYSQLGPPSYQELPTENQFLVTDNPPNLNRTPSYIKYHQTRLSLVAEAPSPAPTPDPQHLQRLAETEAILTGSASIRSRSSNTSKRQSMVTSTSPALPIHVDSIEPVYVQPDNHAQYPIRRRSHLTPGVATRLADASNAPRRSKVLQKPNPKARRQSAATPETSQASVRSVERSKTLTSGEEIQNHNFDLSKSSETLQEMPAPLQRPRFREDSAEMQRMSTPTDLRHIGSFELGSLRVMNGSAVTSAANTPKAQRGAAMETNIGSISPLVSMQPGKQGNSQQSRLLEIKMEPAEPTTISRNASSATKESIYSDEPSISRTPSQYLESTPQVSGGAGEFAEFYRLDIDFLSSQFSPNTSMTSIHKLEATSKHMAEQDELFEDDVMNPIKSGSVGFEQPSLQSDTVRAQHDDIHCHNITHSPQYRPTQRIQISRPALQGVLAVNDSGYSSHASLGSIKSYGSQPRLRETSESPTSSAGPSSAVSNESDASLDSSKSTLPKADFWKTQHAPAVMAGESGKKPTPLQGEKSLAPPLRSAPSSPPKKRMPIPPVPTTVTINDPLEPQSGTELPTIAGNSVSISPMRPSLLQHRTTNGILQKSARHHPHFLAAHSRSSSDDLITPPKQKWHRSSTPLSSEAILTMQGSNELESLNVPSVPISMSLALKGRPSRSSGLKQTISMADNIEIEGEKPFPAPPTEKLQQSIRKKSSAVLVPNVNPTTVTPYVSRESPTARPEQVPTMAKSLNATTDDKEYQSQEEFLEQHITAANTIANSLGTSTYDGEFAIDSVQNPTRNRVSNQPSSSTSGPNSGMPRRDRTGRIIGMDEESASNFARARSKVRAQEAERREALLTRAVQSRSSSQDRQAPTSVSGSNFANYLAIHSQKTSESSASSYVSSVPSQDVKRQVPMKAKREKLGPPPTMLNERNRNGILGYWDNAGRVGDLNAPPGRISRPTSSGSMSAVTSVKKVGFSTVTSMVNLPSMAPQWRGPSPKELAEMALAAKKEGRTSVDAQRRSMSANGTYDKKTGVVGSSRPTSVMSEKEGGRRRWSFRGRKEVSA